MRRQKGIWQAVLAASVLVGGLAVGAFAQGSDTTYVPTELACPCAVAGFMIPAGFSARKQTITHRPLGVLRAVRGRWCRKF